MTSEPPLSATPRTRLRRLRERGRTDRRELYALLDEGLVCHLGVLLNGAPAVLPMGYGRVGDTLYVHGSAANAAMSAAAGQPVCVTVTQIDGIVLARSVFHHSINYRSAMIFGTARAVTEEPECLRGLQAVVDQLAPGQWDSARAPTRKELAATAVLAIPLLEASVKIRSGMPVDEPGDYGFGLWAGTLPVRLIYGEPEADQELPPGTAVPGHVRELAAQPVGRCRARARALSTAPVHASVPGRSPGSSRHGPVGAASKLME